jgi:4-amino-4-deoxy-L-arabinose transferase-like glycosyltransferase
MPFESRLDRWSEGWRGIILAGLITLASGISGLFTMPVLDRDEARFVQATAQMLETGDLVNIRFQDQPRSKKPVGIHWLQAASVTAFSSVEARQVWAYRLPSLLGAMLAAMACAWGAGRIFGGRAGLFAGAILGASFLLSTEAFIAKTDAVLCGSVTLAMAALARIYLASHSSERVRKRWQFLFWAGVAVSMLVKGPVGPLIVALTLAMLAIWDRKAPWMKFMAWRSGLLLVALVTLPWALAITVATDGAFWGQAIGGDLAPKIAGGQESHGAAPGFHSLMLMILLFPSALFLPAAIRQAWIWRADPGVRFAICWFVPGFLMFEALPTKLVHYPLPLYGALAWLMAVSVTRGLTTADRRIGAGLGLVSGLILAILCVVLLQTYGDKADVSWAALTIGLFVLASAVGGFLLLNRAAGSALLAAIGLGMAAHMSFAFGFAPGLEPLWLSSRVSWALHGFGQHPRDGLIVGPVTTAGYAEPSLVFALGTTTRLAGGKDAAQALFAGKPVVVESREQPEFQAEALRLGIRPQRIGIIQGFDYSDGDDVSLSLYRVGPPRRPSATPAKEAAP